MQRHATVQMTNYAEIALFRAVTCEALADWSSAQLVKMQAFRGLARALASLQKQSVPVSQLPELSRWHAESLVGCMSRHSAISPNQYRSYASMPLSTGKERVVVLGTGWAAARLTKDLNCNYYDITVSASRQICGGGVSAYHLSA